jgi:hypothetical protein
MHTGITSSILFVGDNRGIGIEGWAAVGRALSSKKKLKKLALSEEIVIESLSIADHL